jgi:respiratory nitrate reductase gamma subunit
MPAVPRELAADLLDCEISSAGATKSSTMPARERFGLDDRNGLEWGSNLFHVGILVIFLGHFVGLLTPIWIFDTLGISHTFKQWLAIVVGGIAGVMCFIGTTLLVHRRLFDPRIR